MTKIDPNDYLTYEDKLKERQKRYKKKLVPPTLADKAQREEEIRLARESRIQKAEDGIRKQLAAFLGVETETGQDQIKKYIKWVEDSLRADNVQFNPENNQEIKIEYFTPSVKAGGQQRQKSHTAVRVTHLPTNISSQNQSERIADLNKKTALEVLGQRLAAHLELWKMLLRNSFTPVKVEEKVFNLLQSSM